MTTAQLMKKICEKLQKRTNTSVFLGPAVSDSYGLFVWPWRLVENPFHKNSTPLRATQEIETDHTQFISFTVHFLVVVSEPRYSVQGLSLLDDVHQFIIETPAITLDHSVARVSLDPLSTDDLTSLFQSANLPVTACVSVEATFDHTYPKESVTAPLVVDA